MGQRWTWMLERFREKWYPLFHSETRKNKDLDPGFDPLKTKRALGALVVGLVALAGAGPAFALEAQVSAKAQSGFGRLVITLPEQVAYEETLANGVLVLGFAKPIEVDLSRVALDLPTYVTAARRDPDGRSIRFALAQQLTVNAISAGEKLFVDFLPANWAGPPPGLPKQVIAELVARAEVAARAKRIEAALAKSKAPALTIRVGRNPTFSRVVFEWSKAPRTGLSRDGDKVLVKFNQTANPDITRLNVDPPPNILGAKANIGENSLEIEIKVAQGVDVRGYREGKTYILDVIGQPRPAEKALSDNTLGDQVLPNLPNQPGDAEKIVISGRETAETGRAPPVVDVAIMPLAVPTGEVKLAKAPPVMPEKPVEPAKTVPAKSMKQDAQTATEVPETMAGENLPAGQGAAPAKTPEKSAVMTGKDMAGKVMAAPGAGPSGAGGNGGPVIATAKVVGATLRLAFPFSRKTAAAVFQRANSLWLVFDSTAPVDLSAIEKVAKGYIGKISVVASGNMQLVRLELAGRFLSTAAPSGNQWIVSIGDLVMDPTTPVTLTRALRADGRSKVTIDFPGSGQVHWISDNDIGDRIAVVTVFPPARGLIKRQEFVEFTALPTALGLAINPRADDLAVRLNYSEVVITRDAGLTISAGRWPVYVPGRKTVSDGTRPGFIDFENWRQGGPKEFLYHVRRLMEAISLQEPGELVSARLELVRLFIANELGAEALGVMRLAEDEDGEVVKDPVFRAMRGVAWLMMGRIEEAAADFAVPGLANDPHSDLWRGLIAIQKQQWRVAQLAFADGREALDTYPLNQQARFRLGAARAALETSDLQTANAQIEALSGAELSGVRQAELDLLRAWLTASLGETERADELFRQVEQGAYFPVAAEARIRRLEAAHQNKTIDADKAIEQLEVLSMTWRGDWVELRVQRLLAKLYSEKKDFRRALEVMQSAVKVHGESEMTRLISVEMRELFENLFLEGGADAFKPLKALGLYYDFRGLTPVGRRGDEMIRKLAARLVDVDLLDQAADLLDHQVNKRLTGAARAQVAGDLALIYLMARKPDLALRALHRSRQAVLPKAMKRRRAMLEARALAEMGRVERAVELLSTMGGEDVEQSKADALWQGKKWQSAGEQIEKMLGAKWQGRARLTDRDRFNVMRAAISLALADDRLGLERLRRKFVGKMADSPDASAFDVVTSPVNRNGVAFRNLANDITEIDTLSAFLKDFRARDAKAKPAAGQPAPVTGAQADSAATPPA